MLGSLLPTNAHEPLRHGAEDKIGHEQARAEDRASDKAQLVVQFSQPHAGQFMAIILARAASTCGL